LDKVVAGKKAKFISVLDDISAETFRYLNLVEEVKKELEAVLTYFDVIGSKPEIAETEILRFAQKDM
jgi:hypothetical protein